MLHKTMIYLEDEQVRDLGKAKKMLKEKSVSNIIRKAVDQFLDKIDKTIKREDDSLWAIAGIDKSKKGLKDLSERHDEVLYE